MKAKQLLENLDNWPYSSSFKEGEIIVYYNFVSKDFDSFLSTGDKIIEYELISKNSNLVLTTKSSEYKRCIFSNSVSSELSVWMVVLFVFRRDNTKEFLRTVVFSSEIQAYKYLLPYSNNSPLYDYHVFKLGFKEVINN